VDHLHRADRITHIKAGGLFERPQIPPPVSRQCTVTVNRHRKKKKKKKSTPSSNTPDNPILASRNSHDASLSLIPYQTLHVAFTAQSLPDAVGGLGRVVAEDQRLSIRSTEVEETDFLLVTTLCMNASFQVSVGCSS
jgi:hypothetical protein